MRCFEHSLHEKRNEMLAIRARVHVAVLREVEMVFSVILV